METPDLCRGLAASLQVATLKFLARTQQHLQYPKCWKVMTGQFELAFMFYFEQLSEHGMGLQKFVRTHDDCISLFNDHKVLCTAESESGDGDIMNVAEDIRTLAKERVVGQALCARLWIRSSRDLLIKDVIQTIDRLGAAHHDHAAKGRIPDLRGPQPL